MQPQSGIGLFLPNGQEVRDFPFDRVVFALCAVTAGHGELMRRLLDVRSISQSADSNLDQVDDLVSLLGMTPEIRSAIESGMGDRDVTDQAVEVLGVGLGQMLRLRHWWPMPRLNRQAQAVALGGLAMRLGAGGPNWRKVLDMCEFVASTGGDHYHERRE
jgi:hypothetical protein